MLPLHTTRFESRIDLLKPISVEVLESMEEPLLAGPVVTTELDVAILREEKKSTTKSLFRVLRNLTDKLMDRWTNTGEPRTPSEFIISKFRDDFTISTERHIDAPSGRQGKDQKRTARDDGRLRRLMVENNRRRLLGKPHFRIAEHLNREDNEWQ